MNTNGHERLIDHVERLIGYIDLAGKRQFPHMGIYLILRPEQVEELRAALKREREGAAIIKEQEARMSASS